MRLIENSNERGMAINCMHPLYGNNLNLAEEEMEEEDGGGFALNSFGRIAVALENIMILSNEDDDVDVDGLKRERSFFFVYGSSGDDGARRRRSD